MSRSSLGRQKDGGVLRTRLNSPDTANPAPWKNPADFGLRGATVSPGPPRQSIGHWSRSIVRRIEGIEPLRHKHRLPNGSPAAIRRTRPWIQKRIRSGSRIPRQTRRRLSPEERHHRFRGISKRRGLDQGNGSAPFENRSGKSCQKLAMPWCTGRGILRLGLIEAVQYLLIYLSHDPRKKIRTFSLTVVPARPLDNFRKGFLRIMLCANKMQIGFLIHR